MPKKKPVKKQTKKRWDKSEVENQAIIFLTQNPNKNLTDFCKTIKINRAVFYRLCDYDRIYTEYGKIKEEKYKAQLDELKKQEVKNGVNQIIDFVGEIKETRSLASLIRNSITEKTKDKYGNEITVLKRGIKSGEGIRLISELKKTNLLTYEKMIESIPPEVDKEKQDAKNKLDARISELIEFKKANDNTQNITNTDVDNQTATN